MNLPSINSEGDLLTAEATNLLRLCQGTKGGSGHNKVRQVRDYLERLAQANVEAGYERGVADASKGLDKLLMCWKGDPNQPKTLEEAAERMVGLDMSEAGWERRRAAQAERQLDFTALAPGTRVKDARGGVWVRTTESRGMGSRIGGRISAYAWAEFESAVHGKAFFTAVGVCNGLNDDGDPDGCLRLVSIDEAIVINSDRFGALIDAAAGVKVVGKDPNPTDSQLVLAWCDAEWRILAMINGGWARVPFTVSTTPTHWMALPEAPQ